VLRLRRLRRLPRRLRPPPASDFPPSRPSPHRNGGKGLPTRV
jgi:hypothetical protein